jgi:hypothetical protein
MVLGPKQKDPGYRGETRHWHFFAPNKAEVYLNDIERFFLGEHPALPPSSLDGESMQRIQHTQFLSKRVNSTI